MKILLIEDDPDQIALYQAAFKVAGLDLIAAQDGAGGLAKTRKEKPDFILCDLVMEGLSGEEVLKRLKKDSSTKKIPVAVLTNLRTRNLPENCLKWGAIGFWPKTEMMPGDIVRAIKKYLKIK